MNSSYFGLSLNMDRVCRICLTENTNLSPIFSPDQEVHSFSDLPQKIQICGSIDVHEQDGLPPLICDVCIYKANVAHEFRQLCQHSDARLRLCYNKPTRCNSTDCSTQTEPQTRILITKKNSNQQNSYCVKQEEQSAITEIQYQSETYQPEQSDVSETTIDIQDQKLFNCSLGFEEGKEPEQISDDLTSGISESTLNVSCPMEAVTVVNVALNTVDKIASTDKTEINHREEDYLDERLLNESIDDQQDAQPDTQQDIQQDAQQNAQQKRTSYRKAKSMQNKTTFSDEEVDDDYFDRDSDSQDSEEQKFKCKVCLKRYSTQKGLKKHSLIHEKKHKCNICLKMFYKIENLEKHKNFHESKPHACHLCHSSFTKPQSLVRHLKSHTEKVNDIIKQISTDDQKEDKVPKKELKSEEDTEHEVTVSNQSEEADNASEEFENASKLYRCEECGVYCSSTKNLKRHALIHGEKKYSCTVCKKWFFRPDTLKKHAEKHGHGLLDNLMDDNKLFDSDDDPFPNATGNVFGDNDTCKKDDSEDDGTGEYKCQHCDKVMATKKGLRRHVSMHKPKAEPVACEICKKVCASQARLVLHQKTHNKPKEKAPREYLCHICSKVYPSNSSLTYHMRTHTGIKPHVCKTCNSGFTTTTSLANHIRIHTGDKPFVCHVCSAAFAVSSAFRRHLTRHTGEANYLCKTCGKAFKRLSTLKEHTYTHSGEKPYVCKTCGAAYSHSGSLFAHQKRCRAQYGEMVVDDHHHTVAHHIHVNNVQSAVRSLAVIGQMF